MKIAFLSDFHLGYGYNTELEDDSFDNADEAMEAALDSDLIVILGDIFDSRMPKTSVWARAIKILVKPLLHKATGVKLISCTKELKKISERTLHHLPVVALHGNHERRHDTNAVEALENAGVLVHLHCQTVVFEKDGIRIALHGMSSVPERYAAATMREWGPKPLPDCVNILLLHQSIDPYVYSPLEPLSLSVSNLPKGFDLIVNGHIHIACEDIVNGKPLLMPGSTVITQFEENEAKTKKGFYEVVVKANKIDFNFRPLENSRKFFYEKLTIDGSASMRVQIENKLNDILKAKTRKPPLIRLRISGKKADVIEQELREIERAYADKAVIRFVKELESPELVKKIEFLRNLREEKLSVEEIGMRLLKANLEELNFSSSFAYENIFNMLLDGDVERAFNALSS